MTIKQFDGVTIGVVVAIATLTYVFMTPYNRIAGVRDPGSGRAAPDLGSLLLNLSVTPWQACTSR